jgi:7-cyano-7-deazaguanine tRNA-ribosyltransferase
MARQVNTIFSLDTQTDRGGRLGAIHFGTNGKLRTPALFPAICIMTGPPGFGRQGAHYKYIKRVMCREWRHSHFLTEILHFTDYMHTGKALGEWLKKPFQMWMDEMMKGGNRQAADQGVPDEDFDYKPAGSPYEACFFLDSGGFKLLSNSDFNIDSYGYKTGPASILELQTLMGGDIVASLDYPLAPLEYEAKALAQLQEKTLCNAIWLLEELSKRGPNDPRPLAFLAVHGVDYESSKECAERLLSKLDARRLPYESFGFAVGSLVPRRTNRSLVVSIVKGVIDAIREHKGGKYVEKPVHAFGMSGDLIPVLSMLGVDTFDTNSFVQSGKNLRYILPPRGASLSVRETRSIDELGTDTLETCGCRACIRYAPFLETFKKLSRMERDKQHDFRSTHGRNFIKSEVYAFLSMHNLETEYREIEAVRAEIAKNTLPEYVRGYAERANHKAILLRAYEAATGEIVPRTPGRKVSLDLTRDSFAIADTYRPPENKDILLFLPCTKDKPYKLSRSHQAIKSALNNDPRVHIVTISGLYGPVPEELEEEPEILQYDYLLSSEAKDQVGAVTDRLLDYLQRFGSQYHTIAAYVTTRAYRSVASRVLRAYGRGSLLPDAPKEQTSKEFLRYENVGELQAFLAGHVRLPHSRPLQLNLTM